jgi:hypothetical protein
LRHWKKQSEDLKLPGSKACNMHNQETEIRTKRNKQSLVMCQRLFQVLSMKILAQVKPQMQSPKTGLMKDISPLQVLKWSDTPKRMFKEI